MKYFAFVLLSFLTLGNSFSHAIDLPSPQELVDMTSDPRGRSALGATTLGTGLIALSAGQYPAAAALTVVALVSLYNSSICKTHIDLAQEDINNYILNGDISIALFETMETVRGEARNQELNEIVAASNHELILGMRAISRQ